MKTRPSFALSLGKLLLTAGFAAAGPGDFPDKQAARFKVTAKRADDTVQVRVEKGQAVISVKSPFGISQAVVERQEGDWPTVVVVRLHLRALENFRASNGKTTLNASVSVRDGKVQARQWKDRREDEPLNEKSRFWMDVRVVGNDGQPAQSLPLRDGYFQLRLPAAFFEGGPKSITLNWIDFYRQ